MLVAVIACAALLGESLPSGGRLADSTIRARARRCHGARVDGGATTHPQVARDRTADPTGPLIGVASRSPPPTTARGSAAHHGEPELGGGGVVCCAGRLRARRPGRDRHLRILPRVNMEALIARTSRLETVTMHAGRRVGAKSRGYGSTLNTALRRRIFEAARRGLTRPAPRPRAGMAAAAQPARVDLPLMASASTDVKEESVMRRDATPAHPTGALRGLHTGWLAGVDRPKSERLYRWGSTAPHPRAIRRSGDIPSHRERRDQPVQDQLAEAYGLQVEPPLRPSREGRSSRSAATTPVFACLWPRSRSRASCCGARAGRALIAWGSGGQETSGWCSVKAETILRRIGGPPSL